MPPMTTLQLKWRHGVFRRSSEVASGANCAMFCARSKSSAQTETAAKIGGFLMEKRDEGAARAMLDCARPLETERCGHRRSKAHDQVPHGFVESFRPRPMKRAGFFAAAALIVAPAM